MAFKHQRFGLVWFQTIVQWKLWLEVIGLKCSAVVRFRTPLPLTKMHHTRRVIPKTLNSIFLHR